MPVNISFFPGIVNLEIRIAEKNPRIHPNYDQKWIILGIHPTYIEGELKIFFQVNAISRCWKIRCRTDRRRFKWEWIFCRTILWPSTLLKTLIYSQRILSKIIPGNQIEALLQVVLHNFSVFNFIFLCLLKYNSQDQRFSSISFFLSFNQISVPEMAICTFLYVFLDLNLYRRSVPEMNSRVCLIEITSVTIKTPPNLYVSTYRLNRKWQANL